jgi:acylphosphatase
MSTLAQQDCSSGLLKSIAKWGKVWLYLRIDAGRGGGRFHHQALDGYEWPQVMNRKRIQVFYSGSVQGVGFRYSVRSVATGFEVTGVVRNLPDGRVELVAEGAKAELEAFRQAIREAGLDGFIRNEDVIWGEARNEFRGFEIAR